MIPTALQAKKLWETYDLPTSKRIHVKWVACTALFLVNRLAQKGIPMNRSLVLAGALTHDIDKNAPRQPGERHPDAAVRILSEEGMEEVAKLVRTHPLHAILSPDICPTSWEEKILYLADKMVKQEIVGVDRRFALWNAEQLPSAAQTTLAASYPLVKNLEKEMLGIIGIAPGELVKFVQEEYTSDAFQKEDL